MSVGPSSNITDIYDNTLPFPGMWLHLNSIRCIAGFRAILKNRTGGDT